MSMLYTVTVHWISSDILAPFCLFVHTNTQLNSQLIEYEIRIKTMSVINFTILSFIPGARIVLYLFVIFNTSAVFIAIAASVDFSDF